MKNEYDAISEFLDNLMEYRKSLQGTTEDKEENITCQTSKFTIRKFTSIEDFQESFPEWGSELISLKISYENNIIDEQQFKDEMEKVNAKYKKLYEDQLKR